MYFLIKKMELIGNICQHCKLINHIWHCIFAFLDFFHVPKMQYVKNLVKIKIRQTRMRKDNLEYQYVQLQLLVEAAIAANNVFFCRLEVYRKLRVSNKTCI